MACLSIWMGTLMTERMLAMIDMEPEKYGPLAESMETPEFTGHIIWALFNDPKLMDISGQTLIGADTAIEYGIKDKNDKQPPSYRDTHGVYPQPQFPVVIR